MNKVICLFLLIVFSAPWTPGYGQTEPGHGQTENEVTQLLKERDQLLEKLDQPQSSTVRASLEAKLRKIENRLRELGVSLPPAEAPTSPPAADLPVEDPEERDITVDLEEYDRSRTQIPTPPSKPSRYHFEFGVLPRLRGNFFQATAGAPRKSVFITTPSAMFDFDIIRGEESALLGKFRLKADLVSGLEKANSVTFDATLGYRSSANRLELTYFTIPRRLAFITPDQDAFSKVNGIGLGFRHRFGRRVWAQLSYQISRQTFSNFKERDTTNQRADADVRFRIHPLFRPGIGFEAGRDLAESDNFSRHTLSPVLLLDSRLGRAARLSFRLRLRRRDYITTDSNAENFGRDDRGPDFRFYSNIRLTKRVWLFLYGSYTDRNSTRLGRSFTDHDLGLGFMFRLPGG